MSAPESDDAARREDAAYARYMRRNFGVEVSDRVSAPSARGSGEPDEDAQFEAFMRAHFPAARQA